MKTGRLPVLLVAFLFGIPMSGVQFEIRVVSGNSADSIRGVTSNLNEASAATSSFNSKLKAIGDAAFVFNNIRSALSGIADDLNKAIQPGIDFNSSLTDLQAITGVSNEMLEQIGDNARKTGIDFGNDAAKGVESYKLLLSQLSPELAKAPEALNEMGRDAAILSKQLKGDTTAATEILTTAMNQYGVSLDDPIQATRTMAEMMNIMSAGAKEGSAELPQIKSALEQAGMMAKTANVPFNELNAAIQVLDKSGKKGAEGGIALRNIMARLSEGQFMSKQSLDMLKAAGINVDTLSDKSLPLSQRLAALRPIMNDTAAMTQLFGSENVAAGIALANNTDELQSLTQKITGTNTATEMAGTVMGSYSERTARTEAKMKDFGISIFNATEGFLPFTSMGGTAIQTMANLGGAVQAFSILGKTQLVTSAMSAATSLGTWIASTITATAAQWGLNVAITANPIGVLVVAIGLAVAAVALLITYWDDISEAIGAFGKWVWDHNPFKFLIDIVDRVFPGFKAAMSALWDWITEKFDALIGWIKSAWDMITGLFGSDDAPGQAPQEVSEAAAKDFASKVEDVKIPGINAPADANTNSPLAGYDPQAKGKKKRGNSTTETASNITSGGSKTMNISLHIGKLQDQIVIHTTNLEMGGRQAAERVVEILLEQLNGMNAALQGA